MTLRDILEDDQKSAKIGARKKTWRYEPAIWISFPCSVIFWSLLGNNLMLGGFATLVGFCLPGVIVAALIVMVRNIRWRPRWRYSTATLAGVGVTLLGSAVAMLNGYGGSGEIAMGVMPLLLLLPGAAIATVIVAVRNQRALKVQNG